MHAEASQPIDECIVDEVVARYPDRTGDVLSILEELQKRHPFRYLHRTTMEQVARRTGLSCAQVFSVATFYSFFNLQPQGRCTLMVCRGTACHTRGSKDLLDTIKARAGIPRDQHGESFTTPDHRLTVRTVACFGQCALAPVVATDDKIYGNVTDIKLKKILQETAARE